MSNLKESPAWQALTEHQREVGNLHMRDLFAGDPQRFSKFSLRMGDILFDYSKNRTQKRCHCYSIWRASRTWRNGSRPCSRVIRST
jgi:hypothetical protein